MKNKSSVENILQRIENPLTDQVRPFSGISSGLACRRFHGQLVPEV